jgi:uncharacterized protein with ParB-like and HNH nuclease domain
VTNKEREIISPSPCLQVFDFRYNLKTTNIFNLGDDLMRANETTLRKFIEGTKQYVVPLFQRPYSWEKKQWQALWDDIFELYEGDTDENKQHFMGAVVTMATQSVPEGVSKYLLIDGQQRLTTFFILMTLIRDLAKDGQHHRLGEEIQETLLVNKFEEGPDYLKLLPTQGDRDIFRQQIVEPKTPFANEDSRLTQCYRFFRSLLHKSETDLARLKKVVTDKLVIVSIVLDPQDNPHLVFESLNAKGQALQQSDLIRNYLLMRTRHDLQEAFHKKYWLPMQDALEDSLTEFMRHYLMMHARSVINKNDLYFTLKNRVTSTNVETELDELKRFAGYYDCLLHPEKEPHHEVRFYLERLKRLDVTSAHPFLLNCYNDYDTGTLSAQDFAEILFTLENYNVRRFVCNYPTNQLIKIFPLVYQQAQQRPGASFVAKVQAVLAERGYPKNAEFEARLRDVKLYGAGDRLSRTRFILETLEQHQGHKEQVDLSQLTIEHIMPQELNEVWQSELADSNLSDYDLLLHTLGNLTLTAYNSELSNKSFAEKKKHFRGSHLELNRYFERLERWGPKEIEERAAHLAQQALEIWYYFGDASQDTSVQTSDGVTGTKPVALTIFGQHFPVKTWRDVWLQTLDTLADLDPEAFEKVVQGYPNYLQSDPQRLRNPRELKNGFYAETNLSAREIERLCRQVMETIDCSADDWHVEVS